MEDLLGVLILIVGTVIMFCAAIVAVAWIVKLTIWAVG